jgi:hypothetical protein
VPTNSSGMQHQGLAEPVQMQTQQNLPQGSPA